MVVGLVACFHNFWNFIIYKGNCSVFITSCETASDVICHIYFFYTIKYCVELAAEQSRPDDYEDDAPSTPEPFPVSDDDEDNSQQQTAGGAKLKAIQAFNFFKFVVLSWRCRSGVRIRENNVLLVRYSVQ